jgi:ADP-heptose:LPS heptosyltransferase
MSLLVIRTSSMGDVIMTLPALRSFCASYPDQELIFATKKPFDRFITDIPGVTVFLSDHHGRHKGFIGLMRVWRDLRRAYNITAVADLHDVIRSKILRVMFRISGCRVAKIDKLRVNRRALVRGNPGSPLRHTVERYCDVFAAAGFPLKLVPGPWLKPSEEGLKLISTILDQSEKPLIGIAPMAKHKLKRWPLDKMAVMLKMLQTERKCTIFLFGSPDETAAIEALAEQVPGVLAMAGRIRLEEEIALISALDLMVAMDSSNMHLAAMLGTETISVWGATHPFAGFSAWGMPEVNQIQISSAELICRPCTIYGKGECRRGDLACLEWLTPDMVLEKILSLVKGEKVKDDEKQ